MEQFITFFSNVETIFNKILIEDDYITSDLRVMAKELWKGELHQAFSRLTLKVEESYPSKLEKIGLVGKQLDYKLNIFNKIYDKWLSEPMRWIGVLLKAINSILSSLSKAFPMAELIKEFKDFLEISIDYTSECSKNSRA